MADITATDVPRTRPTIGGEWLDYYEFTVVHNLMTNDYEDTELTDEELAVRDKIGRIRHYMELAHARKQRMNQYVRV